MNYLFNFELIWSERVHEFGRIKSVITVLTYHVIFVYTPITYFNHHGQFFPWLSVKGREFPLIHESMELQSAAFYKCEYFVISGLMSVKICLK